MLNTPNRPTFVVMIYTLPTINKGKKPSPIPKGSTLEKELAKNVWYINYSYNGKQHRIKEGLNRIKDPTKKADQAEVIRLSIENDLKNGFNPEHPEIFLEQLTKQTITLSDAIKKYLSDLAQHGRKNTFDSYESKLRHFLEAYPNEKLKDITDTKIETYIRRKIHNTEPDRMFRSGKWITLDSITKWTSDTVKAAYGIFRTFFNWCMKKDQGYITVNPVLGVDHKKIRSEVEAPDTNIPYTDEDMKTVMDYLDKNDPYTAFFCRFIYSTCLRPREICQLQLKNIDLEKQQIRVPLSVMKNTKKKKPDTITIEPNFFKTLTSLNLSIYPKFFYIVSNDEQNIVGAAPIEPDKIYKRLVEQALKKLNLKNKGYTLYSFKHTSNIKRFNTGWTVTEIMMANRHSDVQSTLKYLKDITRQTDISKKEVPSI